MAISLLGESVLCPLVSPDIVSPMKKKSTKKSQSFGKLYVDVIKNRDKSRNQQEFERMLFGTTRKSKKEQEKYWKKFNKKK